MNILFIDDNNLTEKLIKRCTLISNIFCLSNKPLKKYIDYKNITYINNKSNLKNITFDTIIITNEHIQVDNILDLKDFFIRTNKDLLYIKKYASNTTKVILFIPTNKKYYTIKESLYKEIFKYLNKNHKKINYVIVEYNNLNDNFIFKAQNIIYDNNRKIYRTLLKKHS
ncbi:MAG: hypothetical protein RR228_01095 [Bacilli bacterium]